jgi:hypothetical protein
MVVLFVRRAAMPSIEGRSIGQPRYVCHIINIVRAHRYVKRIFFVVFCL